MADRHPLNRRSARRLALAAVAMFGFAVFLLPPLYDLACRVLGINGKTINAEASADPVDTSRLVTVEFVGNVYQDTPLDFRAPTPARLQVHPGQFTEVSYTARNVTDQVLWAQAVHSVVPGEYSKHVEVLACFCFDQQKFEAGEERVMTFAFKVSPRLPQHQETLSVSYTFFKLEHPPEDAE